MSTVQREVSSSETDLPTSLSTVKEKPILFHDKGLYKVVIQLELVQEKDFIIKPVTACAFLFYRINLLLPLPFCFF